MSPTHYLLDSDAAKAVCQYGLIEDLATALGVALSDFPSCPSCASNCT